MLKFILILFLFFYLLYRVGGFFFRMFINNAIHQQRYQQGNDRRQAQKPPNSNVEVAFDPKTGEKKNKNFDGGQYVDFEEIKE